jgi:hypothetical protein
VTSNELGQLDGVRVAQTITALMCHVDLQDFEAAQRLFAPRVRVDYTSLWGGEPADMAPADLMQAWRGIVLGFEATWHEIGAINVRIQGSSAMANCAVDARHWLGGAVWQPRGRYEFELRKTAAWQISLMRLVVTEEKGDRALVASAQSRVAAGS